MQLLDTQFDWVCKLNNRKSPEVIYYDFRSAFERVTQDKLVSILPAYGIGPQLLRWIEKYLSGRKFVMEKNGRCPQSASSVLVVPKQHV